ncbi:hypothetical protein AS888_19725 [Peribacillus simplex]|uniref:Uncharacterized protein n=1 Tax=Peribacillus simplex TaxID=1478 RepID=A0A109MY91_9BACI|nr:hypothetical protein AS888_19725 [Peribacillus simplex]
MEEFSRDHAPLKRKAGILPWHFLNSRKEIREFPDGGKFRLMLHKHSHHKSEIECNRGVKGPRWRGECIGTTDPYEK